MTEKPVAIILPNWNPDEPRFIVKECEQCSDDRRFQNNKCVYNQRLDFAYSVDEIVEVLNNLGEENERLSKDRQLAETEVMKIRQRLNEAIEIERTQIGKNCLKQFKNAIME